MSGPQWPSTLGEAPEPSYWPTADDDDEPELLEDPYLEDDELELED